MSVQPVHARLGGDSLPFGCIMLTLCGRLLTPLAAAEAAALPDEARKARIATLEAKLLSLSHDLQQRRYTLPGWISQRLEERNRTIVNGALTDAAAATADDAEASGASAAAAASGLASALLGGCGELASCAAAVARSEQTTREVQQALGQATELASTIHDAHVSASHPYTTDVAIAVAEKENQAVVGLLRRRLQAGAGAEPKTKMQCVV